MPFQSNVRATFHFGRFEKMASVVALAVTFFISYWIATAPTPLGAVGAYVLFLIAAGQVASIYYMTTRGKVNVLETPAFVLFRIWRPITLGLTIILAAWFVLFVVVRPAVTEGTIGQKASDVFLLGILVGFVEEFVRWVWLQTLPWSVLTANVVWVVLHPGVAVIFTGAAPNWFFAFVALMFGLGMTALMYLYETPLSHGFNTYLGPVLAMALHAGFNAVSVLWKFEIVVPGIGPTAFPPMAAAAVVLVGILLLAWAAYGRPTIKSRFALRRHRHGQFEHFTANVRFDLTGK